MLESVYGLQLPQIPECLQNLIDFLNPLLAAFAEEGRKTGPFGMFAVGHIFTFDSLHRLAGLHSVDPPSPPGYAVTSLSDGVGFAAFDDLERGGSEARSGDMAGFP